MARDVHSDVTVAALAAITHEVIVGTIPTLKDDVNAATIAANAVTKQIDNE